MDNVTHALFGYALAAATPQSVRRSREAEGALIWASVLGSNLPDLDFVAAYFTDDRKLGYLLHHRGHTHTIVFAIPIGILAAWLGAKIARFTAERRDWQHLVLLGVAASLLHIGADALNNYGVHPLYPFDDRWRYGDVLFITEPLVLFSLVPFVIFGARTGWGRVTGVVTGLTALSLTWWILPIASCAFATCWFVACLFAQWRLPPGPSSKATAVTFGALALSVFAFAVGSVASDNRLRLLYASTYASERLVDVVHTPMPAVPICWDLIAVSTTTTRELVLRRATEAFGPAWLRPAVCPLERTAITAPMRLLPTTPRGAPAVDSELVLPIGDLQQLRTRCRARRILTYARVPFWVHLGGSEVVLGDLRYDRAPPLEFAEFTVDMQSDADCSAWFPPWIPPRADIQ